MTIIVLVHYKSSVLSVKRYALYRFIFLINSIHIIKAKFKKNDENKSIFG